MKQDQHTTLTGSQTTPADVCCWAQSLACLHARIAPRFARPEPRRRALAYLQGLLSDTERKNGWHLAEHAREARPDGMQRLLASAVWGTDGVRDEPLAPTRWSTWVRSPPSWPSMKPAFGTRGKKSAGVGFQYCGTTGQVQNCQVGVFLSYVTAKGHTLIDRELYLPLDWCEDRQRCREAGVPESVRFQTKPELAVLMIERLWQAQIAISWVVADTVYGGNLDLRNWLETHQYPYVLAVACNEPVGILTRDGQRRRVEVWEVEALLLGAQDWQRLSMSEGTKGPRLFDWAVVPILHQWEDDGRHWLLIRRHLTDPNEKAYYFVFAPKGTPLSEMVQAIGARWHIEEDFENAKDMGLDHYEVRGFTGWYRHITLVLLALAFLTGICATERCSTSPPAPSPLPARPAVLALTIPEVRHLLARLIWPSSSSAGRVLAWSWWRRCHQSIACYYHARRRLKAG